MAFSGAKLRRITRSPGNNESRRYLVSLCTYLLSRYSDLSRGGEPLAQNLKFACATTQLLDTFSFSKVLPIVIAALIVEKCRIIQQKS
jgi:hypothetical protein